MDTKSIGKYIQYLRKEKHFSQKDLSEILCVSFQAISKWENGENLPDASILLELADVLDTTVDKILNGGNVVHRNKELINIEDFKIGIEALRKLKTYFGENSSIYNGIVSGIKDAINIDISESFLNSENTELLLANIIIHYLTHGYYVNEWDINIHIHSEHSKTIINKVIRDCSLFRNKADKYKEFRPEYPNEMIDLIFSLKEMPVIADIGSGTGKLSRLCLNSSLKLFAIEPNNQMRKTAEQSLSRFENYFSISASAENTTLVSNSIDIITAAESYHWFDNDLTKSEFKRILKPDGYVFLCWNIFGGDEYETEMNDISNYYREKKKLQSSGISKEQRAIHLFGKDNYNIAEFNNTIYQTCNEFCGGWLSASFAPEKDTFEYSNFLSQAEALFRKYSKDNLIKTTIKTLCFYGKLN